VADGSRHRAAVSPGGLAHWLVLQAGGNRVDDGPEQIFSFPDEASILGAKKLLHDGSVRRSEIKFRLRDGPETGRYHIRQISLYLMADSLWMMEHIDPTPRGRYLRLRSTGATDLARFVEHVVHDVSVHDTQRGDLPRDSSGSTRA